MADPLVNAYDLGVYLGQPVDDDRATLLLSIAQAYCEDIVTPLPASAVGVILSAAARAYVNPAQDTHVATGPYQVNRAAAVYLTRQERAALRRAAGIGGAGSTSTLVQPGNAVQVVTVTATAGTFTLAFGGAATGSLAWNASAVDVQTALRALGTIGANNVTVTGGPEPTPFTVTFINDLGGQPLSLLVADDTGLTGSITVVTATEGVAAPGSNLPSWEYDYPERPRW